MKILLALLTCITVSGCTQLAPYRTQLDPEPCVKQAGSVCDDQAYYRVPGSGPHEDIALGIIEFDDQGALHNREQKDRVMDRIRAATQERGTLAVVFAHGWLNDASPGNRNLEEFEKMLQRIAVDDRASCRGRSCECREVVGVYLAWRGKSAKVQPFKAMSFWNRKSRAHRVGQDGATEVLAELAKMKAGRTKGFEKGDRLCGDPKRISRLLIVGHSFGGALIYSATQQLLMKDAAFQSEPGKSVRRTVADLVILVNPAFEAARLTSLHERAAGMSFPRTQSPILAVFTSESDTATKTAFPIGRRLSSLFSKYNPNRPGQAKLDRTALGHYSDYQTHELCLEDETADVAAIRDSVCEWERFREGKTPAWDVGPILLERKSGQESMNPYYNVVVDDRIISGHSGIWERDYFMNFLYRFVAVQIAKECKQGDPNWQPKSSAARGCPSD